MKIITGSLLVGGGVALVLFAIDSYGHGVQRASVPARAAPECPRVECPRCPELVPARSAPPVSSSAAPPASASAAPSASSSAHAPADGASFRFVAGEIALAKGEVPRLVAHAAELRKSSGKISIEAFGDGTDEKAAALGRRRGVLARQLLVEIGLDSERLVVTLGDARAEPDQAGHVRVRAKEAK